MHTGGRPRLTVLHLVVVPELGAFLGRASRTQQGLLPRPIHCEHPWPLCYCWHQLAPSAHPRVRPGLPHPQAALHTPLFTLSTSLLLLLIGDQTSLHPLIYFQLSSSQDSSRGSW